jgi:hypothetical protein
MLKRFLDGLVFGSGFAIALVVVWIVSTFVVMPQVASSIMTQPREPRFTRPHDATVVQSAPPVAEQRNDFSFFKSSERMRLPAGGGILAMVPTDTKPGAKRPNTYQLWLTEKALWQIRTIEERVEIEELPYPKIADASELDRLMGEKAGFVPGQSTMTVSSEEIRRLKAGSSSRDGSLNGKLSMSVEGAVFVMPNPYQS